MANLPKPKLKIDDEVPRSFFTGISMSDKDFARLSEFIEKELGIKMPPIKKTLLETRLQKRLRALSLHSFKDYCDYVFSPEGSADELVHMIDLVTTNKTDFFREPVHFDYLVQTAIPDLLSSDVTANKSVYTIWSAGCSTGEEPYTIAMVLANFAETHKGFDFQIIATDISTRVLEMAKMAIYDEQKADPIPMEFRKKYLLRSKDPKRALVRVAPEIRAKVKFRRLNFMDDNFGFREPLDVIFCRNVMIYFDKPTQERLINKFYNHLVYGGYFFIGHSETTSGLNVKFVQMQPTIYRKI